MSSEDDYYVDLYEKHRDARASRRARRRGSGGGHEGRRDRRGIGRFYGSRGKRRRDWVLQRTARFGGFLLLFLFIGYEMYILHNPLSATKPHRASQTAQGTGSTRPHVHDDGVARQTATKGPPSPSMMQQETESGDATSRSSDGVGLNSGAPEDSRDQYQKTSLQPDVDSASSRGTDSTEDASSRVSGERDLAEVPADSGVQDVDEKPAVVRRPKRRRRRKVSSKLKAADQTAASDSMDSRLRQEQSLEDTPADANAEQTAITSHESPPKHKTSYLVKRGGKHGTSEDRGAEPGASENFWQWFQESKGSANAGSSAVQCPKDNEKLCQMFYKYIRKYKIRTIFDVSCSKNLEWIHLPLRKVGNELWGFKYICSESDPEKMAAVKEALQDLKFVEFDSRQWWKEGFPEDIELLFAWDTLAHTAFGRVWSFFVYARKQEVKWILVDNYPNILNDPSPKREFINLRRHPFRFPAATAVVQDVREVGEDSSVKRQLLLYEGAQLPENLGG